jgi:hypothetical protein
MKRVLAAASACAAALLHVPGAQAEGLAAKSASAVRGSHGVAGRRGGAVADGQGNAVGGSQRGFATDSGAYGGRTIGFRRSSDGSVNAGSSAYTSGANGTARRDGTFTRNADGTASGERNTTVTNANTGVTFDGTATYNKETGLSRTTSCKDAAGNTVNCGSR